MTIAAIWLEDGLLWCAADTRLVVGNNDITTSDLAAKIYTIPLSITALDPNPPIDAAGRGPRRPHYWTQYGFVYAGAALPASQTAINASTILQNLVRPGGRADPPKFEEIGSFMWRLARRFMQDRISFGADGLFQAAVFGWCHYESRYKIAFIDGRVDAGSFRVELTYPSQPINEADPWLVLGSGTKKFYEALETYRKNEHTITGRIPRRVIDLMVSEGIDQTVGGATSIGAAHRNGFQLYWAAEPVVKGQPQARRVLNGLDLDTEVGTIGDYFVGGFGIA
jgi:hypothetical protein